MPLDKEVPWCTVFLCGTALLCHTMVLNGNMMTSAAVGDMGKSVAGWSDIGISVGNSLHVELDALLGNVTFQLTEAIQRTVETQEMVDQMLSQMGESTEQQTLIETKNLALIQGQVVHKVTGEVLGNPMDAVMKNVMKMLQSLPSFQGGLVSLQDMMSNIKPALLQVGVWVETFADKVQNTVEAFGTTLDRVQKIFDHIMSQLSPNAGQNAVEMQHETFNLFDVNSDGVLDPDDLQTCGELYAVDAVKGEKGESLIKTYDLDGDGSLDFAEFGSMVEDPSIVGIMATVLRAYAKRLSMVAGKVGGSRMRDDVATNVVGYFQLVCSKNLTKVGWVSDMLTNGTLPLPFTADVMIELALAKDDPNVLTVADVGEIVIGMMMTLNSKYTGEAFDLLSTSEHWESEGLNMDDMSESVKTITGWMKTGPDAIEDLEKNMIVSLDYVGQDPRTVNRKKQMHQHKHEASLLEEQIHDGVGMDASVKLVFDMVHAMPHAAHDIAKERKTTHVHNRHATRRHNRHKLFRTKAQNHFLVQLLNGQAAQDGGPLDMAQQALASGVMAKPETLLFAQWLMANATQTANTFQQECFDYTGESSSALDAFNTQVQGMVKKVSGFIDIMKPLATPAGIEKMEQMILDFASNAMHDVFGVVVDQVIGALENSQSLHAVQSLPHDLMDPVQANSNRSQNLADIINNIKTTEDDLAHYSPHMSGGVSERYDQMKKKYSAHKSMQVKGMYDSLLQIPEAHHERRTKRMQNLHRLGLVSADLSLPMAAAACGLPISLAQFGQPAKPSADDAKATATAGADDAKAQGVAKLSGIWTQVSDLLRQLEKVLPQAIDLLKFSRKEVSAVSATLDSIFSTLEEKGVPIFAEIAAAWSYVWIFYYVLVMPLTAGILFYGFWAGGFFGGPKPTNEEYVAPTSCWERCCCVCCVLQLLPKVP